MFSVMRIRSVTTPLGFHERTTEHVYHLLFIAYKRSQSLRNAHVCCRLLRYNLRMVYGFLVLLQGFGRKTSVYQISSGPIDLR